MAQHGGQQKINFGGTAYKFHIYRGGVLGGGAAAACLDDDGFGSLGGGTDEGLDPQEIAQLAVLSHPGAGPRDQQQQKEEQEGQEQQPADKASNGGGFFIELGSSDDEDESEDEEEDEEEQLRQKKKRRRRSADEAQQQQEREREQRGRGEGGSDEEGQEGEQQEEEAADEPEEEEEPEFIGLGLSAEAAAAAGLASDSEEDPSEAAARREGRAFGYQPPWHRAVAGFRSPSLKLHNEIVCFCKMLEPTVEESSARRDSVVEVAAVAAGIFPGCKLEVYGSYATGLYTPASDVDCVLTGTNWNNPAAGLSALSKALQERGLVRRVQEVLSARVPIIKFEMVSSGLQFDVSWEVANGPAAAAEVRRLLEQWRALKPLALTLKVFLHQRELNEVYQGGIGSYALVTMIAASLKLHASRRPPPGRGTPGGGRRGCGGGGQVAQQLESNLGVLLIDFFRLYGREVFFQDVGISAMGAGRFFNKHKREGFQGMRAGESDKLLAVEDPLDDSNDVARSSFAWRTVRTVLDHAYQSLTAPADDGESLLGRIVHLRPVIAGRALPPGWLAEPPGRRRGGGAGGGERPRSGGGGGGGRRGSGGGGGRELQRYEERSTTPGRRGAKEERGGSGGGGGKGGKRQREDEGREAEERGGKRKRKRQGSGGGGGGGGHGRSPGENGAGGKHHYHHHHHGHGHHGRHGQGRSHGHDDRNQRRKGSR